MHCAVEIAIKGVVQGVGFRPFIFKIAKENKIKGFVLNNSSGVCINAQGYQNNIKKFINEISKKAPVSSSINSIDIKEVDIKHFDDFIIEQSLKQEEKNTEVSPDLSTCDACLTETKDQNNRRFNYPFTNCTNCGPRFSIIKNIPYDRQNTTMNKFKMCEQCLAEYKDPYSRRFHAEPNACPKCGPNLSLLSNNKPVKTNNPVNDTINLLKKGKIIAIKGLGGFHLAADATNEKTIKLLRKRKYREDKPFALMGAFDEIKKYCFVSSKEKELLESKEKPIVLLKAKTFPCKSVAPKQKRLGFMLPYTPLHHQLINQLNGILVMTSANVSDEPIAYKNIEATDKLKNIADYFLIHNRKIETRCDDSVIRVYKNEPVSIRRSRGYAPKSITLPKKVKEPCLALGAHLKNTFCLAKGNSAYLSHHIGDLENLETLEALEKGILQYQELFNIKPKRILCDLHPEYLSTKLAQRFDLPITRIQHHHAHLASCLLDNKVSNKIIGVTFDGLGYGTDSKFWGGEFLVGDFNNYKRVASLKEIAMPGGTKAIKEPWRMAMSYMVGANIKPKITQINNEKINAILKMIDAGFNSPLTTSMGRLFDAVSAILNICQIANYEGQPAIELQMKAHGSKTNETYKFEINENDMFQINPLPIIKQIINDKDNISNRAMKFHNTVAKIISVTCKNLRDVYNINEVALTGGVFQNETLLDKSIVALNKDNFNVYYNKELPTNDSAISIGQIATMMEL